MMLVEKYLVFRLVLRPLLAHVDRRGLAFSLQHGWIGEDG